MTAYRNIMHRIWVDGGGDSNPDSSLLFDRAAIDFAASELDLHVKNIGDIKYTFDSRENLVLGSRYYGVVQRGKGRYALVPGHEPHLIAPPPVGCSMLLPDATPATVRRYMGEDEQAYLTRLWYSDAFKAVLGCESVHKVQDHWRTTCSIGQIEIDSFFIAAWPGGKTKPVLLSVKKSPDLISRPYLYSLSRLACEKIGPDTIFLHLYLYDGACVFWQSSLDDDGLPCESHIDSSLVVLT